MTNVQFSSAKAGNATLEVLNLIGERVISQDFGTLPAGEHRLALDLGSVKAGSDVYRQSLRNSSSGGTTN